MLISLSGNVYWMHKVLNYRTKINNVAYLTRFENERTRLITYYICNSEFQAPTDFRSVFYLTLQPDYLKL